MGRKGPGKRAWIANAWETPGYKKWESKSPNIVKHDRIYTITHDVTEWMDTPLVRFSMNYMR